MRVSEEIAEHLRDDIISGVYKPRERLTEMELSKKYNVSRTPIREAIKLLEAGGLIKVEPYHGAVIADIDIDEIRDIYEVRSIMEGLAGFSAASNISVEVLTLMEQSIARMEKYCKEEDVISYASENEQFHRLVCSCCKNQVLVGIINDLLERTALFRRLSFRSTGNMRIAIEDHKQILQALREGDAEKARQLSSDHIKLYLSRQGADRRTVQGGK